MNISTTAWFYDRIWKDNLCLLYSGSYGDDITDKFIDLSDYSGKGDYQKITKKISGVIAECFQNIIRHEDVNKKDENSKKDTGFFLSKNCNDIHYITSGNLIENKDLEILKEQLKKINRLDKEGLKAFYRELLDNDEFSKQTMTGLGLVDMARKSGHKLDYLFEDYNDAYSLFFNQIMLKPPNEESESCFELNEAKSYHKKMMDEEILLVHKGDFSHESILTILNIIQKNLREEVKKSGAFRKIYHILVELIQNIGRHCYKEDGIKEGIFLLGKKSDGFVINTGNFIETSKVEGLKEKLDSLTGYDMAELKALYRKTLVEGRLSEKGGAGIGMIDIFKTSKEPMQYKFTRIDDKKTFYAVSVIV
jgi:Family of unknown function (DUF6272)